MGFMFLVVIYYTIAAIVLTEMSAFELKAWIGTTLFIFYATDLITGTSPFNSETSLSLEDFKPCFFLQGKCRFICDWFILCF